MKLSGSYSCLQQFDKFLKCSACNHRKQKLCKSAEIDFEKIRESTSGELIFGGFKSFETSLRQKQDTPSNSQILREVLVVIFQMESTGRLCFGFCLSLMLLLRSFLS